MPRIIIIGAGFGGLSCALSLAKFNRDVETIVLDRKETFDFLPSLPDTLGRGIKPHFLSCQIGPIAKKKGFQFIKGEVSSVDFFKKEVYYNREKIGYDYLVIASGSETNFYGNADIKKSAYTLDSADAAVKILSALKAKSFDRFIVAGAGYTGIEVATNLRLWSLANKKETEIIIVEKADSILGPLPQWMKEYTRKNLARLNIEVLTQSSIERIDGSIVHISGQKVFDNALVIWAAGVKTAKFIQELNAEKNTQGRLKVDSFLRLNENCFIVGDAAYVKQKENYLRMAVQFAMVQGDLTAKNIIRSIKGKKPVSYKPIDLGYIIPMANNYSCGNVFGVNLKGKLPTLLHFIMCIYRLYGVRNKIGFVRNLIRHR